MDIVSDSRLNLYIWPLLNHNNLIQVQSPTQFSPGRNSFAISGLSNIANNSNILVECRTANNTILKSSGIIISDNVGSVNVDVTGLIKDEILYCTILAVSKYNTTIGPIPDVKYSFEVTYIHSSVDSSIILFETAPSASINLINLPTILDSGSTLTTFTLNSSSLEYRNGNTYLKTSGSQFIGSFKSASISFTTASISKPAGYTDFNSYTGTIVEVINDKLIKLSNPYTSSNKNLPVFAEAATVTSASILYVTSSTIVTQSINTTYADITFRNFKPVVGTVDKIHMYARSSNDSYDLINEIPINSISNELLIGTGSLKYLNGIGFIKSNTDISTNWESGWVNAVDPTSSIQVEYRNYPLIDCMYTVSSSKLSLISSNMYAYIRTKNSFYLNSSETYSLTFDAYGELDADFNNISNNVLLDVYVSGSGVSGYTNSLKKIGSIKSNSKAARFDANKIEFSPDKNGNCQFIFAMQSGKWHLSNISLKSNVDSIRYLVPFHVYRTGMYDIRFDYVNVNGNNANVSSYINNYYVSSSNIWKTDKLVSDEYYIGSNKLYNIGSFYDTTTQSGSANTAYPFKLNTTSSYNTGVRVINDGSNLPNILKFDNAGIYNLQFSAQLYNTANTNIEFSIWYRVNNQNVPDTNTFIELVKASGTTGRSVASWNFIVNLNANDEVQLLWSCDAATGQILALPTQVTPTRPATPSIIVSIDQIR